MDDTDEEDSDSDDEADGMVLDEIEGDFPGHEDDIEPNDDDQASLNLRDSDEETEVDTVMMVSFEFHIYECIHLHMPGCMFWLVVTNVFNFILCLFCVCVCARARGCVCVWVWVVGLCLSSKD